MERKCRYVPLSQQPLALVLGQVRFSPIRQMDRYIPEIQEAFRQHGFPVERAGKVQQVTLGPSAGGPIQVIEQQRWEYRTREETWSVLLTEDGIVLQTTDYDRFEGFADELRHAVQTVLQSTEHDRLGVVQRVGLRYVDVVQPRETEDFRDYLRPGLHGTADEVFGAGTHRLHAESTGRTQVRRPGQHDRAHRSGRPGTHAAARPCRRRAKIQSPSPERRADHANRHGPLHRGGIRREQFPSPRKVISAHNYASYGAVRRPRSTLTHESRISPDMDEIMREIMLAVRAHCALFARRLDRYADARRRDRQRRRVQDLAGLVQHLRFFGVVPALPERADVRQQVEGDLGFDDPGDEQRKEHLARNIALRQWPNR